MYRGDGREVNPKTQDVVVVIAYAPLDVAFTAVDPFVDKSAPNVDKGGGSCGAAGVVWWTAGASVVDEEE